MAYYASVDLFVDPEPFEYALLSTDDDDVDDVDNAKWRL